VAQRGTASSEPDLPPLPGAEEKPEEPAVIVVEQTRPAISTGFDPFGNGEIGGEEAEDPGVPGVNDPVADPPPAVESPVEPPAPEPEVDERDPFEP
jgi:hypothetical protein